MGAKINDRNSGGRMKGLRYSAVLLTACLGSLLLSSCGGGGNNQFSITLTTPNGVLTVDESEPNAVPPVAPTLVFTAAVSGDTNNKGVTWQLLKQSACSGTGTGSGQCGTLTNSSPFSVTYTPPSNLATGTTLSVTLTATLVANTSTTMTATITVVTPPVFTLTACNPPSPPVGAPCVLSNGNNGVPYTATISFAGGLQPYTYQTTALPNCLQLSVSTTSATGSITGTPCGSRNATTVTTFTVTVQDSGGAPATSQEYSIQIASPPPLSITTTSLPPVTYDSPYSATVATQGGVAPLTWTFAGTAVPGDIAGLPPGLSANTATGLISGIPSKQPGTYPKTYSFTVQVSDSALPAPPQIAPAIPLLLTITIQAPQPLNITTASLPSGFTATGYSGSLQAAGGVPPYTWTVIQGQLPSGLTLSSLSDNIGSITGTPVVVTTSTFTVQVADSEVNPANGQPSPMIATQQYTISIANTTTSSNNSLFDSPNGYSFFFNGFDKDGPVIIAGTFTTDGKGNITTGTEDVNRNSGVATGASITTGTYSIDANGDGHGTLELTANFGQQKTLVTVYDLVLDSNGNARFFEDNSTKTNTDGIFHTHGEGIIKPIQGSTFGNAALSGNYSFEFSGQDLAGKPAAFAGMVHADGTDASFTLGSGDFNDAGTLDNATTSAPQPFPLSGGFSAGSANRGSAQMTFQVTNQPQVTLTFVFYFVSSSDLFWVEADSNATTGLPAGFDRLGGEMVLQQPTATFNQTILQGVSVASGIGLNAGNSDVFAGLLTAPVCDNSTAVTFTYDENNTGTITNPSFTGTCKVSSNGRVSFSGLGSTTAATRLAVAYLTGPGQGFILGSDSAVTTGLLEQQSGGPAFADLSVFDGYTLGTPFVVETQMPNVIGQVVSDGIGDVTGGIDEIAPPATSAPKLVQALTAGFTGLAASGRGTMTATGTVPTGFPTNSIFYIVSPGSIRLISADSSDTHPNLFFLDH